MTEAPRGKKCRTCQHDNLLESDDPCIVCIHESRWRPKLPDPLEAANKRLREKCATLERKCAILAGGLADDYKRIEELETECNRWRKDAQELEEK